MANRYDKMEEYIGSIFNVFQIINKSNQQQQDKKMKIIALVIYNYVKFMADQYNVDLKKLVEPTSINLIPVFEYVAANNVELYDFKSIDSAELDVTNKADIERFVLTHIYYITQGE